MVFAAIRGAAVTLANRHPDAPERLPAELVQAPLLVSVDAVDAAHRPFHRGRDVRVGTSVSLAECGRIVAWVIPHELDVFVS